MGGGKQGVGRGQLRIVNLRSLLAQWHCQWQKDGDEKESAENSVNLSN